MDDKLEEIVDDLEIIVKKAKGQVPFEVYYILLEAYSKIFRIFVLGEK